MLLKTRVLILEAEVEKLKTDIRRLEIGVGVGKAERIRLEGLITELRDRVYPLFRNGADNNETLIAQSHTHDT